MRAEGLHSRSTSEQFAGGLQGIIGTERNGIVVLQARDGKQSWESAQ